MKTKVAIIMLCVILFTSTYVQLASAENFADNVNVESSGFPVNVAVYIESNIDNDEKSRLNDALNVVKGRFKDQIGYKVDFYIIKSWTSIKYTDDPLVLLQDAISKTDGIIAPAWDNYPAAGSVWRFKRPGFAAGLYIVDQDLEGDRTGGVAVLNYHAAILDYHWDSWWNQFDWLCSGIQHELSHLFGLRECNEPWCVMNYDYMPYETYLDLIIIKIKLSEQWATDWGPNCRQTLINTYEGTTIKRVYTNTYVMGYSGIVYERTIWTETYYRWELTSLRLKSIFVIGVPLILTRPTVPPSFSYLMQGSLTTIEP